MGCCEKSDVAVQSDRHHFPKIIKLNPQGRKISLSFRQAQQEQQKKEFQKYMEGQSDRLTLGDLLKEQFKNLSTKDKRKKEGES